jgi:Predicted S-adenosylmethionine-dependent methyltransferase
MAGRRRDETAPPAGAPGGAMADGELHFYGRRRGRRIRQLRSGLMQTLLPRLEITLPPAGGMLDPATQFQRPVRAVWLEVGFGAGEHLVAQARGNRDVGLIGCEPFLNGVATLLAEIDRDPPDNLRLYPDDARLLLPRLPDASLERVFLLFPDPWPKTRHHRRRFITGANIATLARLIAPGGELRVATDHPDYARWTLALLCSNAAPSDAFDWTACRPADWRRPPPDWVATRYQRKTEAAGASPIFLSFRRRSSDAQTRCARKDLVRPIDQDI